MLSRFASDPWDSNPASSRDFLRVTASCSLGVGTVRTFRYRRSMVIDNAETHSQFYSRAATIGPRPRRRPATIPSQLRSNGGEAAPQSEIPSREGKGHE
jgi:hypothetical protein